MAIRPYAGIKFIIIFTNRPVAPTCDYYDSMHVIRHNYIVINFDFIADFGGFEPFQFHNFSNFIHHHFSIYHRSKQAFLLGCAYRDEICPGLGVIVILQADGAAVVDLRVEFWLVGQSVHIWIIYPDLSKHPVLMVWFRGIFARPITKDSNSTALTWAPGLALPLHNLDLLNCQAVQFIDKLR